MNKEQLEEFARQIKLENRPKGFKQLRAAVVKELEKSGPWSQIKGGIERLANAVLNESMPA